jgi:hypothetical protein
MMRILVITLPGNYFQQIIAMPAIAVAVAMGMVQPTLVRYRSITNGSTNSGDVLDKVATNPAGANFKALTAQKTAPIGPNSEPHSMRERVWGCRRCETVCFNRPVARGIVQRMSMEMTNLAAVASTGSSGRSIRNAWRVATLEVPLRMAAAAP